MNTTENNKLIVQFMELEPIKVSTDFYALEKNHVHITGKNPEIVISGFSEFAKYNTDWNWLMEIVEKIENLGFEFFIVESRCRISHNTDKSIETIFNFEIIGTKIEAVYKACVNFIKWHNEQK